jgi:flavin reductase (DIM6/NTAB) family NADH-FMN oxidoreductase RutF
VKARECVISFIGFNLLEHSWIAALPIPKGISELDVSRLTPLPMHKVKPHGIQECPVNLECKVVSSQQLGAGAATLFTCKVVGLSVAADYDKRDRGMELPLGVLAIDPLFEVHLFARNNIQRLYYARMNKDTVYRTSDEIGCVGPDIADWIGTFEKWMADEKQRGRIDQEELEEILTLNNRWAGNPDPVGNREAKRELTERLKDIVWRQMQTT